MGAVGELELGVERFLADGFALRSQLASFLEISPRSWSAACPAAPTTWPPYTPVPLIQIRRVAFMKTLLAPAICWSWRPGT